MQAGSQIDEMSEQSLPSLVFDDTDGGESRLSCPSIVHDPDRLTHDNLRLLNTLPTGSFQNHVEIKEDDTDMADVNEFAESYSQESISDGPLRPAQDSPHTDSHDIEDDDFTTADVFEAILSEPVILEDMEPPPCPTKIENGVIFFINQFISVGSPNPEGFKVLKDHARVFRSFSISSTVKGGLDQEFGFDKSRLKLRCTECGLHLERHDDNAASQHMYLLHTIVFQDFDEEKHKWLQEIEEWPCTAQGCRVYLESEKELGIHLKNAHNMLGLPGLRRARLEYDMKEWMATKTDEVRAKNIVCRLCGLNARSKSLMSDHLRTGAHRIENSADSDEYIKFFREPEDE